MFKKYQHIERAGSDLVDHILDDNYVIIQPKLDGANASVWFDNNWNIHCGSRNKELLKHGDGIPGFYEYVHENKEKFMNLCKKLLHITAFTNDDILEGLDKFTIYGEWLVPHSFKEYQDNAWKRFYIFDILKHNSIDESKSYFLHYHAISYYIKQNDLDCVPYLHMNGYNVKDILDNSKYSVLKPITSFLVKDDSHGAGIVIKNYIKQRNKHNNFKWAKVVFPHFKVMHKKPFGQPLEKEQYEIYLQLKEIYEK